MNLLEVRGLCKSYPKFTLENVSFSVGEGKIVGLIGKNGAGKSTTIKAILNMVCPDAGDIQMFGKSFRENQAACKQELGVVLGGTDFYQYKKLSDITSVTKRFYEHWDDAAYEKYSESFELDQHKRVRELSSGMRVKYLIALALSHHARLLILDEPTSGLDPVSRDDLLELFKALVSDGKRSILFSTHITSDLDKCADEITYIREGKILRSGDKQSFIESFRDLRLPEEHSDLSLEEIMVRSERRHYDV